MSQDSILDKSPQALPFILGLAAFVLMVLAGPALLNDPDTYWHIALGRWILENGAVPSTDPFSHTMPGAAWHAHEWAAGVLLAAALKTGGWNGVVVLTASAIGLTTGILAWGLSRYVRGFFVIAIAGVALMGFSSHILARPHVIVMPVLMVWAVLLVAARHKGQRPPLAAALLMVPWANMHGSFAIGLGFAALLALEALIEETSRDGRLRVVRDWGLFGFLSGIAALVTPYGVKGFLFPFHIGGMDKSFKWISEWHPPDFSSPSPFEGWLMFVLAVALVRGLRIPAVRLVMCLGLLHLALAHVRMAEYLIFLCSILVAPAIAAQWPDAVAKATGNSLSAVGRWRIATMSGAAAAASMLLLVITEVAPARDKSPTAALTAARQAGLLTKPVFNEYNFGGFLIYERVPTFIDGRADMYGDAFLDRSLTAATDALASPTLPDLLKEHGIGWTLVYSRDVAARLLDADPNWVEFYRDDVAVIHVPAGSASTAALDQPKLQTGTAIE